MTRAEYRCAHLRARRFSLLLDSSELLILGLVFVWGLHMALLFMAEGHDTDDSYLAILTPFVPTPLHGGGLLVLTAVHFACILGDNPGARRRCIGTEILFFLYVAFSLMLRGRFGIDLVSVCVYVAFAAVNFGGLMRPLCGRPEGKPSVPRQE